jgi:hypothetical protein
MLDTLNTEGKISLFVTICMIALIIAGGVFIQQSKSITDPKDSANKKKNGLLMISVGLAVGVPSAGYTMMMRGQRNYY